MKLNATKLWVVAFLLLLATTSPGFCDVEPTSAGQPALIETMVRSELTLPRLFSDNMVLQCGRPVPVWGWAQQGEKVKVTFAGQSKKATAGKDGKWRVMLDPLKASKKPADLTVTGSRTLTLKNVLVGEVWLCSGQSNMEWHLSKALNAEAEIAAADQPLIRHFSGSNQPSLVKLDDYANGSWAICSPETAGNFTAVGYFFAVKLAKELDLPIGLLNASEGSSSIERWICPEGCRQIPDSNKMTAMLKIIEDLNTVASSETIESAKFKQQVFLGLNNDEISEYFSGPAHLPWNRMGNLTGWDGPLPKDFFEKQIALNHLILNRMNELGMHPIIPAFAGFVPGGIKRIYPNEKLRNLEWGGGLEKKYGAHILEPGSELFVEIGKLYVTEWEKEFGKAELYLADSFNEMEVPLSEDSIKAAKELAGHGESVYRSIHEANPEAKWVMQGWTFPFQKDKAGKMFWTPYRLNALVSSVPNDKLIILDLANEYNRLWWKIDPSWKIFEGFFGKGWIYSFILNMGGKVPLNGVLDLYATMPAEALTYSKKKNLVGFGFAPEGIENNEIVYELLSDLGWTNKPIQLNTWLPEYCRQRYGAFPAEMKDAYDYFNKSCFRTFTDHPRFRYQLHPNIDFKSLVGDFQSDVHAFADFQKGVDSFLKCSPELKNSPLYTCDAIEFTTQFLGLKVDELLLKFRENPDKNRALLDEGLQLMSDIDRLLASHPTLSLKKWVHDARNFGDTQVESDYYESNAKRLITTWGKGFTVLVGYAARNWSGMVGDYYRQRWKLYYTSPKATRDQDLLDWEEQWISNRWMSSVIPFDNPLDEANKLLKRWNAETPNN